MRVKPRITRQADGYWLVARPSFGFSPLPSVTVHVSWRDAVGSLVDASQRYVSGGQFELADLSPTQDSDWSSWTKIQLAGSTVPDPDPDPSFVHWYSPT